MTMRFYGKAEIAATGILEAFQNPQELPKVLAPIFIHRKDNVPCRVWSWSNQLIAALHGHADARRYRQWRKIGRHVKKGERGFSILVPLTKQFTVVGFKHAIVYGLSQTAGKALPPSDPEIHRRIKSLPFLDVAREWGLSVEAYNDQPGVAPGKDRHGQSIALGVENLSTWAHEMIHAADDRLEKLTERGQHWRSEIVAELGGAILLTILGHGRDVDLSGCWGYA